MMIAAEFAAVFRKMNMDGRVAVYLEEPDFREFRSRVDGTGLNMAGRVWSSEKQIKILNVIFQINHKLEPRHG